MGRGNSSMLAAIEVPLDTQVEIQLAVGTGVWSSACRCPGSTDGM